MSTDDSRSNEWHRLFSAALNDTITVEEAAQLASLLKSSAEARQLWFLYNDNECNLAELKSSQVSSAQEQKPPARGWSRRLSPFTAAAAGLVIGLFGASLVWGYVGSKAHQVTTLLAEGFENGAAPHVTGFPVEPGVWSGDFSEVVGEFRGVRPEEGRKMLRFRQADYEGKPVRDGYVADLFRLVDLRDTGVATGEATVAVEAHFAAQAQGELQGLNCGMTIYALDSLPPESMRDDVFLKRASAGLTETSEPEFEPRILASATRSEKAPSDGRTWTSARSEMRLPADSRYCLIHLRMHLRGSHRAEVAKPVVFEGLFLDDIRVSLTQNAARP
ncbi:hypothetical protein DES53_10531 [Roseimicrobium gellanilyticum]|uniref:Uncharacterized protein n=1 Tax=Roseimicrobium gellanilyticum TaxID=748857 RepID=A0A366HL24_9BACT|nr:hypothetical protein [Roseimicrobium gellanilyticum]RBP43633.1 hypothetical protein DES53_10531 [Roseimicrobium gellanilyticum]